MKTFNKPTIKEIKEWVDENTVLVEEWDWSKGRNVLIPFHEGRPITLNKIINLLSKI